MKLIVCEECTAEFEIVPLEEHPIQFCPGCGAELLDEEMDEEDEDS